MRKKNQLDTTETMQSTQGIQSENSVDNVDNIEKCESKALENLEQQEENQLEQVEESVEEISTVNNGEVETSMETELVIFAKTKYCTERIKVTANELDKALKTTILHEVLPSNKVSITDKNKIIQKQILEYRDKVLTDDVIDNYPKFVNIPFLGRTIMLNKDMNILKKTIHKNIWYLFIGFMIATIGLSGTLLATLIEAVIIIKYLKMYYILVSRIFEMYESNSKET
jgi:hypothetical protein